MKYLNFNIDRGSIANYIIGEPLEADLESIGPSEQAQKGFSIYEKNGLVAGITVFFRSGYLGHDNKSYEGNISFDGHDVDLSYKSTPENVVSILGPPNEQWNDGVEMCMIFLLGGKEIEVIWNVDKEKVLEYISVSKD